MKTVFALLSSVAILLACQTNSKLSEAPSQLNPFQRYSNLGDALRGFGGVYVSGTGVNRTVTLSRTGAASQEPLYVVDGFPVGTDYRRANNAVNMAEVKTIRVVRNVGEMAQYGASGQGGIILITTEKELSSVQQQVTERKSNQVVFKSSRD